MQDWDLHYYLKIDSFVLQTYFAEHLPVNAPDSVPDA